ncbi:Homocysteine-responsive endoplasmic reticulum-resident ubiquitin-like domain member 1 protein [Sparganum proliferum]
MRHISQISAATPAQSVTNSPDPTTPEPDTPVEDQQQVRPRNILQRWARYLGQPDNAEVEGGDLNGQGVAADGADEGFDVVEFAYTLFRVSLMIAICLAYSSWERIVLVALGVAFFYWHNEEQRNRYLVNLIRRIQAVQLPAPARAADGQQVLAGPDQATIAPTDTNAATEETSPPPPPEAPPVLHPLDRLASTMRLITVTSFRFIYALFTSLVPEVPVPID